MAFSKKFLSVFAALSLVSCVAFGCDSDDDGDGGTTTKKKNCNEGLQGYSSSCACLDTETDWSKTGKQSIVDYLVSICKLSTSFQEKSFQETKPEEQNIGSSCFCYGSKCNYAGYERPELQMANNDAIIYGCDAVAADDPNHMYNGAIRSCFRSTHIDTIKPAIYFPFGACALTMSKCTPSDECTSFDKEGCTPESAKASNEQTICGFAKFGDYEQKDSFTSCPSGEVLMDFVMNIDLITLGRKAKLDVRGCFQGCHDDSDCHGVGVFDPITQEQSQYRCVETDPAVEGEFVGKKAKVCFDKRTIADADSGLTLVHPGNFMVE